jgi:hypothetical protein
MTHRRNALARWTNLVALAVMLGGAAASAQTPGDATDTDPPVRVGRLSFASGEVSFSPAGNDEWVEAQVNRPLVTGDRVWADNNSRAEISVDDSTWWLGDQTSVTVSNLDDRIAQMQIHEGTLDVRVRRLPAGNIIEIDTPNLAFSVTRPGRYRIDVDAQDGATIVAVREGAGDVYGENASYVVAAGQAYRFYGTDLRDSELVALPGVDAFERWSMERDRRFTNSVAARYVSPDVVGYEDLDSYGTWSAEATYGNVWFPRSVASDWAPYREGHWAWIDPWGWTWVDEEPWGFAPFHYGRWSHFGRGWGWIPGPRTVRAVYAPALVAFIGGAGFSLSVSSGPAIGWFPLAPREVYVPSYRVSRNYFRQVNVSNTVVNVTNITNIYDNPARATQLSYANRRAPNAVTAVPPAAFAQSHNVSRAAIAMPATAIQRAEVHSVARVAPARPALLGATPIARARPPAAAAQRPVVAKVAPPPPPVRDAQKLQALEKNPGQPLSRAEVQALRRAAPPAAAAAPSVRVVEQPKPQPNAAPPARAAGAAGPRGPAGAAAPETARGRATERAATPAGPGTPAAKGPPAAPPTAQPGERTRSGQPGQPAGVPPARDNAPSAPPAAESTVPGRPAAPSARERPEGGPPAAAARVPGQATRPPEARRTPPPERAAPARPPEAAPAPAPRERAAPARPPEAAPAPAPRERAAPQRPPEARSAPQRPPEAQPAPQRPPEARPAPQRPPVAGPEPQRPPEARAAPQRPPEARPAPQRPPEARPAPQPAPQERAAPQRPPEARPQPPAAQSQPQPPAARPAPPPQAQPRAPAPERGKGEARGKDDKKDDNKP